MRAIANLKLRTKLTLGVVFLLLLSCGGMGFFSYRSADQAMRQNIEESLPILARETAEHIQAEVARNLCAIESVAHRNVIRSMKWETQRPALEEEAKRLGYMGMGVVTPDGQAHYPDGKVANLGDRSYVREAFAGKTNISEIIVSRVTMQPVFMLATPIYDSANQIGGVLIARQDAMFLSRITNAIKYGKNGYAYIIDRHGALIAHPDRELVINSRNFIEESQTKPEYGPLGAMMKRMVNAETGFDEYWFSGGERLFGFAPVAGTGWSIAVGATEREVFAEIKAMRLHFLLTGAFFTLLGLAFALIFGNVVARPIQLISATAAHFAAHNRDLTQAATAVAEGDLSQDFALEADNSGPELEKSGIARRGDEIGELGLAFEELSRQQRELISAFGRMRGNLRELVAQILESVVQVSSGATQIAAASEALSQGATESASSLEEVTASMTQIGAQARQNAENAHQANQLTTSARQAAEKGGQRMTDLVSAMGEIGASSQQISNIIKTIDGIAFQTNLLALNAAVEAARAGRHGKGFAVVAEEVRNLASRSAKAARETAELIENSVSRVENGTAIANQTAEALAEIFSGVTQAADLVDQIASGSSEQAQGVAEISQGLGQIDGVTQQNTSQAEETAAAAEELSGQARSLQDLLARFKLQAAEASAPAETTVDATLAIAAPKRPILQLIHPGERRSRRLHRDKPEFKLV